MLLRPTLGRAVGAARRALDGSGVMRNRQSMLPENRSDLLSSQEFNARLAGAIIEGRPVLVGRPGSFEAKICNEYLQRRIHRSAFRDYSAKRLRRVEELHRDGFPLSVPCDLDVFAEAYIHAALQSDYLALWRGGTIGHGLFVEKPPRFVAMSDIDPTSSFLRGVKPWTLALAGKRVLVVHPFTTSIKAQYDRREDIKTVSDVMPSFQLQVLAPPRTYGGWHPRDGAKWEELLLETTSLIAQQSFDVAIVAAGPYGLPIAAFIKSMGRPAVHLGASTQLLFGIRGSRWEREGHLKDAMDDSWVRPDPTEVPPSAQRYENAAYW